MGHLIASALHPEFPLRRTGCWQPARVAEAVIHISTGLMSPLSGQPELGDIQGENEVNERH